MRVWGIVLVWLALLAGCAPLERPHLAVFPGIRIDTYVDLDRAALDLDLLQKRGFNNLMIELIAMQDSLTGLPKISRTSLTQFSRYLPLLRAKNLPYTLCISHNNGYPLFLESGGRADSVRWFAAYYAELNELLGRAAEFPPQRLVLGDRFDPVEHDTLNWNRLIDSLRLKTKALLTYSTELERIEGVKFWPKCDEIAVHERISPFSSEKNYAREWHGKISQLAIKLNKPVFIAQTNLAEPDKILNFKQRVRFWEKEVKVTGVTLNSIYPYSAFSDSTTYFGVQNRPDFNEFIDEYRR